MDRMKKEELIKLIESLEIDSEEFMVLSSSSLVMRGLFEDAGDLDIAVTKKGLEQLKEKFNVINTHGDWYQVNERCECVLDDTIENQREKVGNYYLQDLRCYRDFLVNSDRPKDKIRLEIVEKALNK